MILGKPRRRCGTAPNTDVLVGVENNSYMFLTGPDVVKQVSGGDVSPRISAVPQPGALGQPAPRRTRR